MSAPTSVTPLTPNIMPPRPLKVETTGLDFGFLADLVLKIVYADANCTTERAAEKAKLSMPVAEELLQHLYREKFVEIRGLVGYGNNRYGMLDHGWQRAQQLLELNGYIGPAPVSLPAYTEMVIAQNAGPQADPARGCRRGPFRARLAAGHSANPGPGSELAPQFVRDRTFRQRQDHHRRALHSAQSGEIWIPYSLEIDGQVIRVFDLHNHQVVSIEGGPSYDERWVKIKRPIIIVGGEMTIETMDLIYSQSARFYEAPFQMKANGGTLLIDDFGRQRVDPHDLLNRWIVPLEGHIDFLTLHTGKKIEVPFEQLLIFATNLDPNDLVDEAFLRRMGYRLYVNAPDKEMYGAIFKQYVEANGFGYKPKFLDYVYGLYRIRPPPAPRLRAARLDPALYGLV